MLHKNLIVRKDPVDWRDRSYGFSRAGNVRNYVDLREWASPIEDQWNLGSCTGQAIVGAYELQLNMKYPEQFTDLSRLFVYYNARKEEGFINEDIGAYVRDGLKAVSKYGICKESLWPYDIKRFADMPSTESYNDAKKRTIKNYYKLYNITDIIDSINANSPVVLGMQVYPNFGNVSKFNSVIEIPGPDIEPLGGHAVCIVGYDLNKEQFLIRNSFGTDWGDNGYAWAPFKYGELDFMDCWTFDISVKL